MFTLLFDFTGLQSNVNAFPLPVTLTLRDRHGESNHEQHQQEFVQKLVETNKNKNTTDQYYWPTIRIDCFIPIIKGQWLPKLSHVITPSCIRPVDTAFESILDLFWQGPNH